MILTFDVVGSDDSIVVLLLVSLVGELVLVSDLESLPVDVRIVDDSVANELKSTDEVEGFADVEPAESEFIEVEVPSFEVDEESLVVGTTVELDGLTVDEAVKVALEADVVDWAGDDVSESPEASEVDVDSVAVESLELVDLELISILADV